MNTCAPSDMIFATAVTCLSTPHLPNVRKLQLDVSHIRVSPHGSTCYPPSALASSACSCNDDRKCKRKRESSYPSSDHPGP